MPSWNTSSILLDLTEHRLFTAAVTARCYALQVSWCTGGDQYLPWSNVAHLYHLSFHWLWRHGPSHLLWEGGLPADRNHGEIYLDTLRADVLSEMYDINHLILTLINSQTHFILMGLPQHHLTLLSYAGSGLYSFSGRSRCTEVRTHQSREACPQLHDGYSALQKGLFML